MCILLEQSVIGHTTSGFDSSESFPDVHEASTHSLLCPLSLYPRGHKVIGYHVTQPLHLSSSWHSATPPNSPSNLQLYHDIQKMLITQLVPQSASVRTDMQAILEALPKTKRTNFHLQYVSTVQMDFNNFLNLLLQNLTIKN